MALRRAGAERFGPVRQSMSTEVSKIVIGVWNPWIDGLPIGGPDGEPSIRVRPRERRVRVFAVILVEGAQHIQIARVR